MDSFSPSTTGRDVLISTLLLTSEKDQERERMSSDDDQPTVFSAVVYGSIATAIVSILSLSGACILPLVTGRLRQRWMQFFIAMAVSTLSSDALLHLIPEVIGVHTHAHEPHEHSHNHSSHEEHHNGEHHHGSHEEHERAKRHAHGESSGGAWELTEDRERLLWLSVILAAVYCVYLFEFLVFYKKRHVHHPEKAEHCPAHDEQGITPANNNNNDKSSKKNDSLVSSRSSSDSEASHHHHEKRDEDEVVRFCGLTSRALVILVGDGVHNLVDGVAIGTSFLASPQLGIVTSIAVVCHELPHELGDLAVLLDSGMSMTKALLLNLLSALSAFIGLYLAIAIGRHEVVERVLLALTAGMFLYVAWIDMLSHLKHDGVPSDHWAIACSLQFAGFFVGFAIVFLVGWFEHDMFPTDNH